MSASVDREGRAYIKRSLTKDDFVFLKELQHELNNQPTLATADPRYWVIRDYEYREATSNDEIDAVEFFEDGSSEIICLNEAVERVYREKLLLGGVDHAEDWLKDNSIQFDEHGYMWLGSQIAFEGAIKEYAENNMLDCMFLTKVWAIVPCTMFLTLREAEEHLKANFHHYSTEAHAYGMCAWRSPEVAQLIKLLHTVDFDELAKLLPKEDGQ
nr:MAG TPA: hypothetical protein [Caudoviricetes sp.]